MFKVGDLVKFQTKHQGKRMGVIIKPYYSPAGCEWIVNRLNGEGSTICCPSDLEVVSHAGR